MGDGRTAHGEIISHRRQVMLRRGTVWDSCGTFVIEGPDDCRPLIVNHRITA